MNDNNLHKIFANTDCISTEMMMDYLAGKLSEKEKNAVEVHIESCEMCRDEFEGLSLIEDHSKLDFLVASLDRQIDERIAKGGKKIWLFRPVYKVAAAVVFLLASTWLISLYLSSNNGEFGQDMVSQAMEEKIAEEQEIIETIATDSIVLTDKKEEKYKKPLVVTEKQKDPALIEIPKKDKGLVDRTEEIEVEETEFVMDEEIRVEELSASSESKVSISSKNIAPSIESGKEKIVANEKGELRKEKNENRRLTQDVALEEERDDIVVTRGKTKRTNKKSSEANAEAGLEEQAISYSNTVATDNFNLAMIQYRSRDYKAAIDLLKKSLKDHNNKDEIHYYLAKSYVNIDEVKKALSNYNKVIEVAESQFYEEALWDKTMILIEMDKKRSAINSLNLLKKHKGSYSEKAGFLLDSLNSQ